MNPTTPSILHEHDPSEHDNSFAEHLRDRGFPIAGLPAAADPEPDGDEPDDPQQAELPTGPTHIVARRSKDQLASAKAFIASAGKVKFDRGRCTLRSVWMSVAYYASLGGGPERVCFAQVKTLADRALVSERTIRTHLAALVGHGLIQTKYRGGGHTPTHWKISALLPSVLGGEDCRAGRQELPGRAAGIAAEVSNRSLASTKPELLASKQPDGACAPPSAQKDPPQKTKREQQERTDEPTEALAQGKKRGWGVPQGGITEKQIGFLKLLADRVGAEHAEDLWRAADPKRLQVQIKAAVPFKDLKGKHTHGVDKEAVTLVWNDEDDGLGAMKSCIQLCICGAARSVMISKSEGVYGGDQSKQWTLVGHIVNYDTYASDLVVTISDELQEEHDTGKDRIIELTERWRARQMPMSYVAALCQSLPKYGDDWSDAVVPVERLDG